MQLRAMTVNDFDAGLRLCRAAGWNQQREDWERFLLCSPAGCFVVEHDQDVVGTVATLNYANRVGWIAMVLVEPSLRRQGIGTRLMRAALDALSHCECVKLDATAEGRTVYVKLGFTDESSFSRMTLSSMPNLIGTTPAHIRDMGDGDIDSAVALDRIAFGASRGAVLESLYALAPEYAFVAENEAGDPVGFTLGRHGHGFEHIGPIVAPDLETAKELARAAFLRASRNPVLTDVSLHTPAWVAWLRLLGFSEQRRLIRMWRGANACSPELTRVFAIAGPELG
ncbi:MAG: GNAT family N-acetyltransferase [Candidatus Hydrogenedentes bacterium]|nr:GNAT family N-acetyltransferase [Candidatus Hydrogenedentota bacterium]